MPSADHAGGDTTVESREPGRGRAGRRVTLLVVVVLTLGAAGAFAVASRGSGSGGAAKKSAGVRMATVTRTDLSDARDLPGTLGFGAEQPIKAGRKGIVTWLPKSGDTITRGKPLYRLDDRPVSLFYGTTPMFRPLGRTDGTDTDKSGGKADPKQDPAGKAAGSKDAGSKDPGSKDPGSKDPGSKDSGGKDAGGKDAGGKDPGRQDTAKQDPAKQDTAKPAQGRDVRMVADNLKALGYDIGTQPTGTPTGEATWTPALTAAAKKWQKALGVPQTGVLEVGDVTVLSGEIRVGALTAALGDDTSTSPVLTATPTAKVVSVLVAATDIGSIAADAPVTVALPDGTEAKGAVSTIGRSAERKDASLGGAGSDAIGAAKTTVTVTLDDAEAVRNLDAAGVQVRFVTETRKGVLTVPIGALVALREGGYAVQLAGGRLLAVKTGLFVKGMVEVEGGGLEPGTRVVTTP